MSTVAISGRVPLNNEPKASRAVICKQLNILKRERPCYISSRDGSQHPGCRHYACRVEQYAECCGVFVPCRQCHNEAVERDPTLPQHTMDRFAVRRLRCTDCGHEQSVEPGESSAEFCTNTKCNARFAAHHCTKCMLFHDCDDRDIYHCDDCKICRLGKPEDNYHCTSCDACVSRTRSDAEHVCLENSITGDCPVCKDPLFASVSTVVYMRCGHAIHEGCLLELIKHDYRCCICAKSLTDMSAHYKQLDSVVEEELNNMPPELARRKVQILCNDCGSRSIAPFHFSHFKCRAKRKVEKEQAFFECGSYNTCVIGAEFLTS